MKLSLSSDHGASFSEPVIVDAQNPAGRVDLTFSQNKFWLSWLSDDSGKSVLKVRSYTAEGKELDTYIVEGVSSKRNSGFPQITRLKEGVMIAYTDITDPESIIRTLVLQ